MMFMLELTEINLHIKFEMLGFVHSKDMAVVQTFSNLRVI